MRVKHFVLAAAVLLLGCLPPATRVMEAPREMTHASDKIAEAMGYNRRMAYTVEHEPDAPVRTVRPDIELQGKSLDEAKANHEAAGAAFERQKKELADERDAWRQKYDDEVRDFARFRAKTVVVIALWVERLIIIITALWVVAGVTGVLLTAFGGFGVPLLFRLGRGLLSFIPAANLFTGASHVLEDRFFPNIGKKW